MDTYWSYAELSAAEVEGVDYRVVVRPGSSITVLVPHGGGIEPGTSEIASEVAGDDLALYLFEGLKPTENSMLHITSHHFDEPRCLGLLQQSDSAVSIHGGGERTGSKSSVFVGGRDYALSACLIEAMIEAGFSAQVDLDLPGTESSNIFNLTRSGQGAQLEIAEHLREQMFSSLSRAGRRSKRETFFRFCSVIRLVLPG